MMISKYFDLCSTFCSHFQAMGVYHQLHQNNKNFIFEKNQFLTSHHICIIDSLKPIHIFVFSFHKHIKSSKNNKQTLQCQIIINFNGFSKWQIIIFAFIFRTLEILYKTQQIFQLHFNFKHKQLISSLFSKNAKSLFLECFLE